MSIVGILPIVLTGLVFLGLAYVVWQRKRWAAILPLVMGLGFVAYAIGVKIVAGNHSLGREDYQFLIREMNRDDLREYLIAEPTEENLYFASITSQALYRAARAEPDQRANIIPILRWLSEWVADSRNFPQWKRKRRWSEEAFFLAHAGIILGQYQELTDDEAYAEAWQSIGAYLGRAMRAARYKNLISRPEDDLMRPADNAAILYGLMLFDRYYATEYAATIIPKWLEYVDEELKTADSHLPCSAFTNTNVCRLDPTASALGMTVGYLAAAGYPNQQLYREWLHYFKVYGLSPLTLETRSEMFEKTEEGYCDQASLPLACERHLDPIAAWLAAEHGGDYTFARLTSERIIYRDRSDRKQLSKLRVDRRPQELIDAALWTIAIYE
ncbi:hypothetical protein CEQ90_05055 [Lewinellaceae bacterium SD302]|nr:hypothetical protein CEQ90_05055 [Lewinellaceae bacterium SD302]